VLPLADARARLLESTPRLATERWPVGEASGRVVAHDLWASTPIPPRPVAARRGFAIRHRDAPGRLQVWGRLATDEIFDGALGRRRAVRVEAGAVIPGDATAVVSDLDLPTDGEHVTVRRPVERGEGILGEGSELGTERPVVSAGTRLDATHLLLLDRLGIDSVEVRRPPRIALLPRRAEPVARWLGRDARAFGARVDLAPWGVDEPDRMLEAGEAWDVVVHVGASGPSGEAVVRNVALHPGGDLRVERTAAGWLLRLDSSALGVWAGWRWVLEVLQHAWTGSIGGEDGVPARLASDLPRDPARRRIYAVRRTRSAPSDLALPVDGDSAWSLRGTWGTVAVEPGAEPVPADSMVRVVPWP
jgi:molybdopterin biosynthesis enzyme